MNHKRGRPKSTRAGCLLCKSHKHQAAKDTSEAMTAPSRRAAARTSEEILSFHEGQIESNLSLHEGQIEPSLSLHEGETGVRHRSSRGQKNLRRWCRGREGTPHEGFWVDDRAWLGRWPKSTWVPQILKCRGCGKHLDHRYICRLCGGVMKWSQEHKESGCPEPRKAI